MSQEWLKQLAELSNDKDLRKRAQQMQQKAQRATVRQGGSGRTSLLGAAIGHFFRWLFLLALAQAAAMFVAAESEDLTNESWGYIFHYVVWYALTQPLLPAEAYGALQEWFGLTAADFSALYDRINPVLQEQQDALVFLVPAAVAVALTLFFLPAINARRRRSPVRILVWLANWAVVFLATTFGPGIAVLWLAALAFSFVGGLRRAPRQAQPPAQPRPPTAAQQARPASQPQPAARAEPAAMPARESAIQRSARPAAALNRREPTVVRRGGGSWIRAR
jgi:hypothetical protein